MDIDVDKVILKQRIRQNLGDLSQLAESIQQHGLMNPIVINEKNELIAGHRRLEAVRSLGWPSVPVRIVSDTDEAERLEMEIDENVHRKSLSTDELADAYMRLERMRNPGWLERVWKAIRRFFRRLFGRKDTSV